MNKLKLQWKIFGFLLVFCLFLLTVLWLLQTVFLDDMYKSIRINEINNAMLLVEKNIDNEDLQSLLRNLDNEKEVLAILSTDYLPAPPANNFNNKNKIETITKTKEFIKSDGSVVSYTFYAMISPVNATITTIKIQLYIITLLMIIFSIVTAFIIAKLISKPIVNLNNSTKSLATGDYSIKFDGKGFLEIKELSDTLNMTATELSKVDQLRKELIANISHDLKTPLALIYSYAEMMNDFPKDVTTDQTQTIMEETKRLTSLVNDILDISKLESGVVTLNITDFNLTKAISNTTNRISEMLKKDGFNIIFNYNEEIIIKGDEIKILQVFYNILTNAINYSGNDKKIIVTQTTDVTSVKILIQDFGQGISKENLPYIWDRYYKIGSEHKRGITGTGLGLSIVKKIMELHNGTYGADSELNKGTTMWFALNKTKNL